MFNIFHREKTKIKAVSDQDLIPYLKSLNIYEDVLMGRVSCKFCGRKINIDNLQALLPHGQKICFICSNIKCLTHLHHD
jgi:hypothetical protein